MKKIASLGEQEMTLLQFIDERPQISVREVAQHFEKEKNLARTTVLTVMERLRKKGFLNRSKIDGIFKYSAKHQSGEVLSSKVSDFIERTLGGSVSPLIAYFMSEGTLSESEMEQLRELGAKLEQKKAGSK